MKKKIFQFIYYLIGKNLPASHFPLGDIFNKIRILLLKQFTEIGGNCKVQNNVYFGNGENIQVGNNCEINEFVKLRYVTISNDVLIGPGVTIIGTNHKYDDTHTLIREQGSIIKPVFIDDDVWIATNVIVLAGVTIGKGCVIGAGSVVTKDCLPYGVYAGMPAKLIKKR